ncbi:hypothetical protein LTR95_013066, partial [Oleoguttula sp. CCFEE 5521]
MAPAPPHHQYGVPPPRSGRPAWHSSTTSQASEPDIPDFGNAFRDIDNLYGGGAPRSRSTTPERRYWRPQVRDVYSRQSPSPARVPLHRHEESASSITPLMDHGDNVPQQSPSPVRRKQASPIRVPIAGRLDDQFHEPPPKLFRDDGYGSYDHVQPIGRTNMPALSSIEQRRGQPATYDRPIYRGTRNVYASENDFENVNRSRHSEIHAPVPTSAYIDDSSKTERSDWLDEQRHSKKRMKWIIGIII